MAALGRLLVRHYIRLHRKRPPDEIVLDRSLAEAYIFPAIDLPASSTRKMERLYSPEDNHRLTRLRRELAGHSPRRALELLLDLLAQYPTNEELLQSIKS